MRNNVPGAFAVVGLHAEQPGHVWRGLVHGFREVRFGVYALEACMEFAGFTLAAAAHSFMFAAKFSFLAPVAFDTMYACLRLLFFGTEVLE